jgi:hypothetical protein
VFASVSAANATKVGEVQLVEAFGFTAAILEVLAGLERRREEANTAGGRRGGREGGRGGGGRTGGAGEVAFGLGAGEGAEAYAAGEKRRRGKRRERKSGTAESVIGRKKDKDMCRWCRERH